MTITETEIWDRFNQKSIPVTSEWLEDNYSLDLSLELRHLICERLGLLADKGWESIKNLLKETGNQPELIHAAGLCHQIQARDYLLECLKSQREPQINIVKALACWGAFVPKTIFKKILNQKSLDMRLAGLNLLHFKSHLLSEVELLDLVEDLLIDFREQVVINTIKVLQRRNEEKIIKSISKVALNGSDKIVEISLVALGSIGTKQSSLELSELSRSLVNSKHQKIALKQITHQHLNPTDNIATF